jgi:radical SAM enzyme (TIGR01210 family)
MMMNNSFNQILESTQKAGKFYTFDEAHDENLPVDMWFQESDEGLILFIVFYSQTCRWSRCLGCNLPAKMSSKHVSYKALIVQIDHVFGTREVTRQRENIRKVIVSNNGSILDEVTFSSTALMYLLVQLNLNLPNLELLSIETRVEYVEFAELEFISRALTEGETPTQLELAIGFEAFDDYIRNRIFNKGLALETFEDFVSKIASYKYRLKCYFMQKPVPGMTDAEAILDIQNAIDYLSQIVTHYGIGINMHLNPTYVATGTILETAFRKGEYVPPLLQDVARAALHAKGKPLSIFIGLFEEGLAVEGGSFLREGDEELKKELERFNCTQDYDILERVCASGV